MLTDIRKAWEGLGNIVFTGKASGSQLFRKLRKLPKGLKMQSDSILAPLDTRRFLSIPGTALDPWETRRSLGDRQRSIHQ